VRSRQSRDGERRTGSGKKGKNVGEVGSVGLEKKGSGRGEGMRKEKESMDKMYGEHGSKTNTIIGV